MTYSNFFSNVRNKLLTRTDISTIKPGTIARELIDSFVIETMNSYSILNSQITQSLISEATGPFLDELGLLVGVSRESAKTPYGEVTFYIDARLNKTVSDIVILLENEGVVLVDGVIIISQGTIVSNGEDIEYRTTEDVILSDAGTTVPVVAMATGSGYHVGTGELNDYDLIHNPELMPIKDFVLVKNNSPISNGADVDDDETYRFRITNSFEGHAKANEMAIRLAALSVPGISDVFIRNYEYGIGTYGIYVITETPVASDGVLSAAQEVINMVTASGIRGVVTTPDYEAVHMEIQVAFVPTATAGQQDDVIRQAEDEVIDYINNLGVGEDLIIDEVRTVIMNTSDLIRSLEVLQFGRGKYNRQHGVVDNYDRLLLNNQHIPITTKWVTNARLINLCSLS